MQFDLQQPALTDTLVSNIRKRHSDEHHTDAFIKKSKVRTALASGNGHSNFVNNIADDGDDDQPLHSLDNDYSSVANATATSVTPPAALTMTTATTTTSAGDNNKVSTKRGRKVALTAKEIDSQIMIIDENSSTSLHDVSNSSQSNKNNNNKNKKRRRKNQTNQPNQDANSKDDSRHLNTAASTSDEDEECSALNCIRPAGNCQPLKQTFKIA